MFFPFNNRFIMIFLRFRSKQMNESERIDPLHHEHFENFDYYTDYSETPDSITSSSQFTNNDCMMNNTSDTDNNNNVNGALNNSHKNNCKEANSQQVANDSDWLSTPTAAAAAAETATTATAPETEANSTPSPPSSTATQSDACNESQADNSSSKPSVSSDENVTKKSDLPSTTTKSPAKQNTNKKIVKSKKVGEHIFCFVLFPNSMSKLKCINRFFVHR